MNEPALHVLFPMEPISEVGGMSVESLKSLALAARNRSARICLHRDHGSAVQQMLIVFQYSTLVGPHRQQRQFKSYVVLEGQLRVIFFDDNGKMTEHHVLKAISTASPFLLRFPASRWHLPVSITEWTVFIETGEGPFAQEGTEYPAWGPSYGKSDEIRAFLDAIRETQEL